MPINAVILSVRLMTRTQVMGEAESGARNAGAAIGLALPGSARQGSTDPSTAVPAQENDMSEKSTTLDRPAVCAVLRAGTPFVGKQGFSYAPAVSAETVRASAIHMQLLTIPPGGRAKAHKHEAHETAIYVISGEGAMYYGEQ